MKEMIALGLYIGVSGCSLKDEASIAVVKEIPLEYLVVESSSPFCDIRDWHARSYLV